MKVVYKLALAGLFAAFLSACTAGGDPVDVKPIEHDSDWYSSVKQPSSSDGKSSAGDPSSSESGNGGERDSSIYNLLRWVEFQGGKAKVNSVEFSFSAYSVSATEVTQAAYAEAMGGMPDQPKDAPENPVVNVSWFDAVLFCNELSKSMGLDTAYVYSSVESRNQLRGGIVPSCHRNRVGNRCTWRYEHDVLLGYGQGVGLCVLRTNFWPHEGRELSTESLWPVRYGG